MVTDFEREKQLREACAELDRRLRSGENCSAESVLTASPILAADKDSTLELVYTEFAVRDELNLSPQVDEWYSRFPGFRKELQELFEVHRYFSESATLNNWIQADTLAESATERLASDDETQADAGVCDAFRVDDRAFSFGDYQVCREVGRGAMGVVYEAKQLRLNRIVAIKMILDGEFAGTQQLERFQAECGAIARLQHPNIVQIFEVGEHGGQAFCSLEFVHGGGLDQYLEHNRPTIRECTELVEILSRAIAYVHKCGIVHRDLKPANVLLHCEAEPSVAVLDSVTSPRQSARLSSFVPKITDFGLAKQYSQLKVNSTQDGTIVGTPGYMAPEQAFGRNKEIGPATDVHALGAILYETLVGQPPYHAPTLLEVLELVRNGSPIPLTRLRRNIPRDLETICLKCLEKDPARRYLTAMDLADDLRRFLNHEAIQARPADMVLRTMRWCQRRPLIAGLCLALATSLLIGMVGIFWQWRRAEFQASVAFNESVTAQDQRAVAINERARAEENLIKARKLIAQLTRHADKLTDQPQMDDAQRATLEEILDYYRAFIDNNPSDPRLRLEAVRACVRVGALQDRLGKFDLAESTLRKGLLLIQEAEASSTNASEWRIELGICWKELGHVQRSKKQFEDAHAAYLESIQILQPLLGVAADKISCAFLLANAYMNQAVALRALDRTDDAAIALRQAIDLQEHALSIRPKDSWNRLELALALDDLSVILAHQGRWIEAMPYCKQALQIRTDLTDAAPNVVAHRETLARSFHNMGKLQLQAKQIPEGIESLRMAVQVRSKLVEDFPSRVAFEPQLVSSVHELGLQLFRMGEREQSLMVYENALKISPDQAVLLNSAAWIIAACDEPPVHDLAQALAFAEKATKRTPDSQAYWNTLGVIQYRRGEWEKALGSFRKSVTLPSGENCFNWLFLAMTEFQLGEHETASQWHQKAVRELERAPTQDKELIRFRIEADAMLGENSID